MTGRPRFAFVEHLDPMRAVEGTRGRYDCPDVVILDRHLDHLRRRIAAASAGSPIAEACRRDIDRLLDRREWLTLETAV